jgi:hypothetical protein
VCLCVYFIKGGLYISLPAGVLAPTLTSSTYVLRWEVVGVARRFQVQLSLTCTDLAATSRLLL